MFKSLSTLTPYLRKYKAGLTLGIGAFILKDLFGAALPVLMEKGVDSLTAGLRMHTLLLFSASLVAFSLIKGVFQYWMRVIIIGISRDIEYDLRNDLFAHVVGLSQDF